MFEAVRALSEGPKYHIKGIRFAFKYPSFLVLAALPFIVTLALYVLGFYFFSVHLEGLLQSLWHVPPEESSRWVGWLYWAYSHTVRYVLYLIILAVMFYSFVIFANILASPLYDHISEKYERTFYGSNHRNGLSRPGRKMLTVMKEEIKKAAFMLTIPLILVLIPVIGSVLCFVIATAFIAWDYVDFSLARDRPMFRDRIKTLWQHKLHLIGFGWPLLVPFFGIAILPFAILGSTKLYYERIK